MYHAVFFTNAGYVVNNNKLSGSEAKTLGAYRLASELRSRGYKVIVIDYFSTYWAENLSETVKLLKSIISQKTLFVGYSGTFFQTLGKSRWPVDTKIIRAINKAITTINPKTKILYGGAYANDITEELLTVGVDYIVQGLADSTIIDIADSLSNGKLPKFSNIINNVKIISYDTTASNFDFRHNSVTKFTEDDFIIPGETIPIEIGRGCRFKCSFCAYPLLGRNPNDISYIKDPTAITQELIYNYENFNTTNYIIVDDTFNESTEKLTVVQKAIKDSGVKIQFFSYIRADLLARYPEQTDILLDMGLVAPYFGIESLNHQSGKSIGKGMHPDRVKKCLIDFKKKAGSKVVTQGGFIVGLPYDTEETLEDNLQWMYDHPEFLDAYQLSPLSFDRGTVWASELSKNPGKYGYEISEDYSYWKNANLDSTKAKEIADRWNKKTRDSNRTKIAATGLMSMLNLGYSFDELYHATAMPIDDIKSRLKLRQQKYVNSVFTRVNNICKT